MIRGIAHVGIAAKTPSVLANWYCDTLNMEVLKNINDIVFFVGDRHGAYIEIYPAKENIEKDHDNYVQGIRHLAIRVDDFDFEYQRLLEKDVKPAAEIVLKDTFKLGLFYDIEGNLFHIVERNEDVPY